MKAVVLAGGRGTRLGGRIPNLPKPMAPVAGRPFLEYVLDRLVEGGIREITLSVGYRSEAIQAHFGTRYQEAALRYAPETEPLGTGGAIANALREDMDTPALVLNGDTFLDLDYRALLRWYEVEPAQIAIVLTKVPDIARFGAVAVEGSRITGFSEKGRSGPGLINAGIYVLQPAIFARLGLAGTFSMEADLLQAHCATLQPKAYLCDGYFIDIGIPDDLDRAEREMSALKNLSGAIRAH